MELEVDPPIPAGLAEEIVDLWVRVSRDGGTVGFTTEATPDQVRPVAREQLEAVTAGERHLVLATEGTTPVGLAFLIPRPPPLFAHVAVMKRLQVDPDRQGRGIGGRIVEEVHDLARGLGREIMQITARGGTGVEAFYARHGYRVAARLPGIIRVAPGDDRDELVLLADL